MTKTRTPAAPPAPTEPTGAEAKAAALAETPSLRDEFAMRMAAAIVNGIVSRGGLQAFDGDATMRAAVIATAYDLADIAMGVRAAT